MKTIWIIGMGKFGSIAVDRLERIYPSCQYVLVDPVKEHLNRAKGSNRLLKHSDGVFFLLKNLNSDKVPDWIIPALPVHLLAEWIIERLKPDGFMRTRIPKSGLERLPNLIEGKNGDLYVSHADFTCPDNCPEPGNVCFVTGQKRKQNMYDLISAIEISEFRPVVVRSHQLAPGVGGYRTKDLFKALKKVANSDTSILIATACRCHGVITGVKSPDRP